MENTYVTTYTIEHRGSCVLITGAVPVAAFPVLTGLAPKGSVLDSNVARILDVTFAFGPVDELNALRATAAPAAVAREQQRHPQLSDAAARWLATGYRGTSSNTIFTHLTGVSALGDWRAGPPLDADDVQRCCLLLEQVPELQLEFPRMAEASPEWAALVADWPAIRDAVARGDKPGWCLANDLVDAALQRARAGGA